MTGHILHVNSFRGLAPGAVHYRGQVKGLYPKLRPGTPADLGAQAAAWLRETFPAAGITGKPDPYRLSSGPARALPCVAAILTSAPGDDLLLEHPETGLHPRSQSAMGLAFEFPVIPTRYKAANHEEGT